MKKRQIKNHIKDGFSELAPDIFEAVVETAEEQNLILSETKLDHLLLQKTEGEENLRSSGRDLECKLKRPFPFGKSFMERFPQYVFSACAGLVIICLCIFGGLRKDSDGVYFVLDINPSIQVEVDQSCQVKRLKGLNQDGKDVIKELSWKKHEPVQELIDILIQDVVEKSYLSEGGGILVTISALDNSISDKLEYTLSEGISQKLTELEVFGVTTAFQRAEGSSGREGRELLEAELMKTCGFSEEQVQGMTVLELIQYCQTNTSMELDISEVSEKGHGSQQTEEDKGVSEPSSNSDADYIKKDKAEDKKDSDVKDAKEKKQSEVKDTKKKDSKNKDTKKKDKKKPEKNSTKGEEPKETSVDKNSAVNGNVQYPQAGSQSQEPANIDVPAPTPPPAQPDTPVQPGQEEKPAQVPADSSDKNDDKDKDKDNGNNKDKDKNNGNNKDKDKDNGNNKDKDKDNGNNKDKDKDNGNNKDKDKDNGNNKDKDKNNGNNKDKDKDKEGNNKDKDKENGNNKDKGQEGGKQKVEQIEGPDSDNESGKNQDIKIRDEEREK